ncbi:MAG: class I SAM-dependent methyltransferase [Alphaproteobacteria bacterium]
MKFLDLGCGKKQVSAEKLFSDRLKTKKKIHLLDISKEMLINSKKKVFKKGCDFTS